MPASNNLRLDPSRTATLQRAMGRELMRRLVRLVGKLSDQIRDVAGSVTASDGWVRSRSDTAAEIIQEFEVGLFREILTVPNPFRDVWWQPHLEKAYLLGIVRAYNEARPGRGKSAPKDFTDQAYFRDQFKVIVLGFRTEIQGITTKLTQEISRAIRATHDTTDSFARLASSLRFLVGPLRDRVGTLTRTELVRAQAAGQVDAYQSLGVPGIVGIPERPNNQTACGRCNALAGKVYTPQEARGVIPVHPRCRCAWRIAVKTRRPYAR